jgi:WD40 repeat protein/class 3 adenylate cyclase
MSSHPSVTVTFLFTDIEGSTKLWEQHAATMSSALAQHDTILRTAIRKHKGVVFKTVGDAFYAAFSDPPAALDAALTAQQDLAGAVWAQTGQLRVRMALHTGVAEIRDADYFGPPLNRVARLLAAGHGGQILLTATTYELVRGLLPGGVELHDLGVQYLKDLARPEHIWQVAVVGRQATFPPLKTLGNAPDQITTSLSAAADGARAIVHTAPHVATLTRPPEPRQQEPIRTLRIVPETTTWIRRLADLGTLGARALAWATDGRHLAAAGPEGVHLYDAATLQERHFLPAPGCTCVAFTADGQMLAAGAEDGAIRLWRMTGLLVHTLSGHAGVVRGVAFAPDGRVLASAGEDRAVRLWRVADGLTTHLLLGHTDRVTGVAFAPTGTILVSSAEDKTLRLWRTADGILLRTMEGHTAGVLCVAFAPDGQTLASGGGAYDRTVRLWRVTDGTVVRTLFGSQRRVLEGHTGAITSLAWAPDGQTLASGAADRSIRLWNPAAGVFIRELVGHTDVVSGLAWAPDGQTLASGAEGSAGPSIRLWQPATGTFLRAREGHVGAVTSLAFAADGSVVASGSMDETVRLWHVADGTLIRTLGRHSGTIWAVAFAPNGQTLAATAASAIWLWRVADGTRTRILEGHRYRVTSLAWAPDGQVLASGSWDGTVRLWPATPLPRPAGKGRGTTPVSADEPLRIFDARPGNVNCIAFSPDGTAIAAGSQDGTVRLWRVADGTLLLSLTTHLGEVRSLAFAPNSPIVASADEHGSVRLWSPGDGRPLAELDAGADDLTGLAFTPDGQVLVAAPATGAICLWSMANGQLVSTVEGSTTALAMSPTGEQFAVGHGTTVRLWGVPL